LRSVLCGYHNILLRANMTGAFPRFLFYYLSSRPINQILLSKALGITIMGISARILSETPITVPPDNQLQDITETLDLETTRIDDLIEKKTRFIELLKEKRQALITQAVTKGLDPDVPMTDSGVEWIGAVPAHWEEKR